jgi:Cu2+-containing amine oxidase
MPVSNKFVRSTIAWLSVATVTVAIALLFANQALPTDHSSVAQQRIQPLDPLTPEEIELARQVASSDPKVKAALGSGRQRLIQVEFFAQKPADTSVEPERMEIGRHAHVLFYRYEGDEGVDVVVDLQKKAVVSVSKLPGTAVPLGTEEVVEAFNLAAKNDRVRSLLGTRLNEFRVANLATGERPETRVEGLRVVATSPRDPCYRRRCIHLLFHDRDGYLAGTTVTVNLTAQTVRAERTTP